MICKNLIPRLLAAVLILVAAGGAASAQSGGPFSDGGQGGSAGATASGEDQRSCSQSEVREAESRSGGRMMSVRQSQEGGSTVCQITVLVPSEGQGKPRRTVVTVRP